MALANEMVLDLTEALKKAEQMDKHLASWVDLSSQTTRNLKKGLQDAISSLQSQLNNINGNGIGNIGGQATQSIDGVNELLASLRQLSEAYSQLKEHKGSVIDLGDTTKQIKQLEDRISAINTMIKKGEDENKNQLNPQQQQALVDERAVLSQQLRIQQQSIEKKIALEEKALDRVTNLLKRHLNERANEEIKAKEKAQKEYAKRAKQYQEQNKKKNQTYEGALAFSGSAKTLNREIQAVKNLEAARNALSKTDAKYERKLNELNKRIREHNANINRAREGANQLRNSHRNLMNISEQLTRRLALVFSVSQITGYVKKLASVRGEFELQQKSLAAIIQNKDKANEIFDKVTKLAVQSPFQLKELVSYTKQLAAYKIETGKLYDNVKMLADISAGVGVDMSRLVLAYGQVASANYLRGTELRQFSEAGINVLGGLSDYFTELKGRAVGVAEVFDMVSKRMVKFSDVEEVLRRMTEEGGEFYNMQAIQAQTLKGQISNLQDSIEIMLNEIGTAQERVLKGSVALVREFAENWRHVANTLTSVGGVIASIAIASFAKKIQDGAWAVTKLGKAVDMLKGSWTKLATVMKSGVGIFGWVGIIFTAVAAMWKYNKAVEAANKQYIDAMVIHSNEIDKVEELSKKYIEYSNTIKQAEKIMSDERNKGKIKTDEYLEAQKTLNLAQKEQKDILSQLKNEYPELYANLNAEKTTTEELTKAIEKYNDAKRMQMQINYLSQGGWFRDDLKKNITDAEEALTEYDIQVNNVSGSLLAFRARLELQADTINKTDYDRVISAFNELQKAAKGGVVENEEWTNSYKKFENILQETGLAVQVFNAELGTYQLIDSNNLGLDDVTKEIEKATNEWYGAFGDVTSTLSSLFDGNFKKLTSTFQNEWNKLGITVGDEAGQKAAYEFFTAATKEMNIQHPLLMKKIKKWFEENVFGFEFEPPKPPKDSDIPKLEWVQRVYDDLENIKRKMPEDIEYLQTLMGDVTFDINLPKNQENYEEYYKEVEKWVNKINEVYQKTLNDTDKLISKEETDNLKLALDYAKEYFKTLGGGKLKNEKKPKDTFEERLRILREMYDSYKDLNKTFDATKSIEGVDDKYRQAFKDAFGFDFDVWGNFFTNEEDYKKALQKLKVMTKDAKDQLKVEIEKGRITWDIEIKTKLEKDEKIKDQVEELFSDYESMLELNKLGISGDAAYSLFGIESMDLDGLRAKLENMRDEFVGTDMEEEYKKFQDKLTEMEVKAQQERLKKYLGNIRDNISDRAKLKIEELQKLKEIEDSFVAKEGASEEEKQAIETAKKLAIEGLKESTNQQLQKMDWEDFQKSDYFISMFDDLDNASSMAINSMITQLENYKDQWTDMPLDDMKKVIDLINKLKDAADEKITNPFYAAKKTEREIAEYGRSKSESESDFETFTDMSNYAEEQAGLYEQALIAKTKILTVEEQEQMLGKENMHLLSMSSAELEQQRDYHKGLSKDYKKEASLAQQQVQRYAKLTGQYEKQAQVLANIRGTFNNLVGAATDLGEALGMDEMSKMWTEIGGNVFDTGLAIAEGALGLKAQKSALDENATAAEKFGYSMNMALGIIGYIAMAIQLVAKVITAINKAHDDKLQKQIERDAEAVELLQKRYEKLEEAIDNAMSFGEYQQAFDENKRNLEEQIRLTEDMIALEEDKKKTDEDAIKGYKDNIEEYNEQLQEMEEKRISDMGGFGSQEAIKDAAMDFIDAWAEAYNETGDGLDALKDKWDEYFDNLLKKQMLMKVANKYIEPALKEIDKALEDDVLTGEEMENLERIKEESSSQLNNIMKQLAEQMGWEGGTGGGSELDGLSESIQGVTEITAQALEAILNSMRFYVIDNNTQLKQLVEKMDIWSNPQSSLISELRNQTTIIDNIYNLFYSVVDQSTKTIKIS